MVVNVDAFAKLPDDIKTIFKEEAAKIENELWTLIEKKDAEWIAELPAMGIQTIEMEPKELAKLEKMTRPLWNEWAGKNAPFGPILLETAKKAAGK